MPTKIVLIVDSVCFYKGRMNMATTWCLFLVLVTLTFMYVAKQQYMSPTDHQV